MGRAMPYGYEPNDKDIVRTFNTLESLVERAELDAPGTLGRSSRERGSWSGTQTFDEAVELSRTGYNEVRPEVDTCVNEVMTKLIDVELQTPIYLHDVNGPGFDIDRFCDGDPECFFDTVEIPDDGNKVVVILIDCMYDSAVSHESIIRRGSAVTALIEVLTRVGYQCEVWTEATIYGGGSRGGKVFRHSLLTRVKEAGQELDVDRLMYPMAHPSFFRRIVFGAQEVETDTVRKATHCFIGGGYGGSGWGGIHSKDEVGASVTVEAPNYHQTTAYWADWIRGTLEGLNIQLDAADTKGKVTG
jgi:hypothetical protein